MTKKTPDEIIPPRRGQPPHEPNDVTRRIVTQGIACRMSQEDVAAAIGVCHVTLRKHYEAEITGGKAMTDLIVADALIKLIKAGDFQAIKLYMLNQMGFRDKIDVTAATNEPEVPLAIREFNKIIAQAALRRSEADDAAALQDRPVLVIDHSAKPPGHG